MTNGPTPETVTDAYEDDFRPVREAPSAYAISMLPPDHQRRIEKRKLALMARRRLSK